MDACDEMDVELEDFGMIVEEKVFGGTRSERC